MPYPPARLLDGKKRMPEVTAGHTFYLEELDLQPGDFVSYYARAADNDAVGGGKRASSDLYFVQIRPLRKERVVLQQRSESVQVVCIDVLHPEDGVGISDIHY